MTILTTAAGAVVSGLWKLAAIALAVVSLALCAYLGHGWYMAAHDRDQAIVERDEQKALADQYQTAIREQNTATEALGKAKEAADARGRAAQQLAAANGRRFDSALDRIKDARATTCDEAMPAVNEILEAIK